MPRAILIFSFTASYGTALISQQGGAAVYTTRLPIEFLKVNDIDVFGWPFKSPALDPIENLWGIIAMAIYKDLFSGCHQSWVHIFSVISSAPCTIGVKVL